ncbi:hypothetical protein [Komagataeibacter sp. FNDCR2]|nr:hypothetical protein [Komagataeibacter sp. FNDCR2]
MLTLVQMLAPVVALLGFVGMAYGLRMRAPAAQPVRVRARR